MKRWLREHVAQPLRKLKITYVINNLFNRKRLRHAERMYAKYGVQRNVVMPISSEALPSAQPEQPWLDTPEGAQALPTHPGLARFDAATQAAIKGWPGDGYLVLRGLFSAEEVAAVNAEVDRLVADGTMAYDVHGKRILFAIHHSALLRRFAEDRRMLDVMDFLTGKRMRVFQSLNFAVGSEQHAHSDTIHMTTYPLGFMVAAWIALEPVDSNNGPLVYHPGSHKLPYLLNSDYDHGGGRFSIGEEAYGRYEERIQEALDANRFPSTELHAQPGDVLFWHANLLHGGKRIVTPGTTRRSMVLHCFADDVLCYHELTQRAALMDDDH